MEIKIGNHYVGENQPVYFVAEIGSNHDGDLKRAIELIRLAAESGANAAKFQNFSAPSLISDFGFKKITNINSHQSKWKKSVFEVYQEASTPFEWANKLCEMCTEHGLDYFSAPYDLEAVNMLERYFPAVKIGSGDITWLEIIELIASKNKPVLMSTGASTIADVQRAVETVLRINKALILMQYKLYGINEELQTYQSKCSKNLCYSLPWVTGRLSHAKPEEAMPIARSRARKLFPAAGIPAIKLIPPAIIQSLRIQVNSPISDKHNFSAVITIRSVIPDKADEVIKNSSICCRASDSGLS